MVTAVVKSVQCITPGGLHRLSYREWGDAANPRVLICDDLIATPINLGSSELVSINDLVSKVEQIAGIQPFLAEHWRARTAASSQSR